MSKLFPSFEAEIKALALSGDRSQLVPLRDRIFLAWDVNYISDSEFNSLCDSLGDVCDLHGWAIDE